MKEQRVNIVEQKSKAFALRIVKLYQYLRDRKETVLSKQVLRSGTSIGANIAEGKYAQSKDDFNSKHGIALKEASETLYWLDLLTDAGFFSDLEAIASLRTEAVAKPRSARDSRARPVQHCARESRALRSLAKSFATASTDCEEIIRILVASIKTAKGS